MCSGEKKLFILTIFLNITIRGVFGANILFISPIDSVSHHIWNEVLVGELLEKGHNITLIGYRDAKIKSENYTVYKITGFEQMYEDMQAGLPRRISPFLFLPLFWYFITYFSEANLKSDALKTVLDYPRDKFDLIIFDIVCGQELYPLIEYFGNPPVVGISPFFLPPHVLDTMGGHFYSYAPFYYLDYTDDMTFFQRVENVLLHILDYILKYISLPKLYRMAQERFGEDITPFDQMEKKIGILLANYDHVLEYPQPLPPNIIPVGGLHVKRSEKLPNDLHEILDNSNDGVIYFSFGTIVQPAKLPVETKKMFLNVFSKLKQTVLWKYTADDLEDIPKNVIIRKWYPQNDILAHKNIKLFITHGGGLSSHEVMYHGVPVLPIPFFADQYEIAAKMTARKLGKQLHIRDLTEDILYATILELISDPIYKQNMLKISRIFRDQKETPLERAIFWIEYALRNKDLSHLSIRARDMSLFQRENLDVYGIILLLVIIFLTLFFAITKCILNRLIFERKQKIKQN